MKTSETSTDEPRRPLFDCAIQRNQTLSVAAILAAVVLWGGSFSVMRVALKTFSPYTVMWIRMMIALIIVLPFTGKLGLSSSYRKGDWKLLIPMVLFQPCLYFLLESYALRFTTSSQAGVITASVPLIVGFGAWLLLSEPISKKHITGLLISISGVVCLTLLQGDGGGAEAPVFGNTLELFAMACGAANMLVVKQLSRRYNPWALTALQTAAGSVFFLPGLPLLLQTGFDTWSTGLVIGMIYLGAFVTLGAFGLYNWGLSRIPASRASLFINLVPVAAVLFGWTLLGESLNPAQCLAAIGVVGGVCLSQMAHKNSD